MATLDDFRLRAAAKLSLTNDPAADQPLIDSWANEAVVDILLRTGCYVDNATPTLTADEGDYDIDTDALLIKHAYVTSGGQGYRLEPISPAELLDLRHANATSASPTRYYAHLGANRLLLYPAPAAGDTLAVLHVPKPAEMRNGTDDPALPAFGGIRSEFHKAIEYYILWQGGDADDDASSAQGERYRILYEGRDGREGRLGGELAKIRAAVSQKVGKRPRLRIGPPRQTRTELLRPGQRDI